MGGKLTPQWERISDRLSIWTLPGGADWLLEAVDESKGGQEIFKKNPPTTGYELSLGIPNPSMTVAVAKYDGTESRRRAESLALRITRRMQAADAPAARPATRCRRMAKLLRGF